MTDRRDAMRKHNRLRGLTGEALDHAAKLAEDRGSTVTLDGREVERGAVLREAAERLRSDRFTLAVVGEFSRGKSTLINALLGHEELLPTAIEPTTAAITVLSHGEAPCATVHYQDGTSRPDLRFEDLPQYVAGRDLDGQAAQAQMTQQVAQLTRRRGPKELTVEELEASVHEHLRKPRPAEEIERVEVTYPSDFLADGIRIVDTPGIGSVNPRHGEATREFVRQADAVLFLINTNPPIGASECNFLTFLQDYVDHFLFAVTQIDRFDESERERSLNYTRDTIAQFAGLAKPRILPISARLALEAQRDGEGGTLEASGFPQFLDALDELLIEGRGHRLVKEYVAVARAHVGDMRQSIAVEQQAVAMNLEELHASVEAARPQLDKARATQGRIMAYLGEQLRRVPDLVAGETGTEWIRLNAVVRQEVNEQIDSSTWEQLQRAPELIPILVREILRDEVHATLDRIAGRLEQVRAQVIAECRETVRELNSSLAFDFEDLGSLSDEEFEFRLHPELFRANLSRASTLTVGSTIALTLASGFLFGGVGALVMLGGGVLAGTKLTALCQARARERIKREVEGPIDQVMEEMMGSVETEVRSHLTDLRVAVAHNLAHTLGGVEESIARLVASAESAQQDAPRRREELKVQLAELDRIESMLQEARFFSA